MKAPTQVKNLLYFRQLLVLTHSLYFSSLKVPQSNLGVEHGYGNLFSQNGQGNASSATNAFSGVHCFKSTLTGITNLHDDASRRRALLESETLTKDVKRNSSRTNSGRFAVTKSGVKRPGKRGRPSKFCYPLVEPSDAVKQVFRRLQAEDLLPYYQQIHSKRLAMEEMNSKRTQKKSQRSGLSQITERVRKRYRKRHYWTHGSSDQDIMPSVDNRTIFTPCISYDETETDSFQPSSTSSRFAYSGELLDSSPNSDSADLQPKLLAVLKRRPENPLKWKALPGSGEPKLVTRRRSNNESLRDQGSLTPSIPQGNKDLTLSSLIKALRARQNAIRRNAH